MWSEPVDQDKLLREILACLLSYLYAEMSFLAVRPRQSEAFQLIPFGTSACDADWWWHTILSRYSGAAPVQIIDFTELPESLRPERDNGALILLAVSAEPETYLGAVLKERVQNRAEAERFFQLIGHLCACLWQGSLEWQRQLAKAVLEERERLRREIHDTIAQTVSYLVARLSSLMSLLDKGDLVGLEGGLKEVLVITREAYEGLRESLASLRTPGAPETGLASLLETYVKEFEERSGIRTKLVNRGDYWPQLAPDTTVQLLRIVQEALTNVRKHAQANEVEILLEWHPEGDMLVQVRDNGCGFDLPELARTKRHQFGLSTMRERARAIGARLEIETAPGSGTLVKIILPRRKGGGNGE